MSTIARTAARALRSGVTPAARSYATVSEAAGVKVAGIDNGQATTTISVVVKGGSRFESQPGAAHALKSFLFKSSKAGSTLKTIRETELYGGVLSTGLSREHLFINAEFLRGDEDYFLSLLSSVLSSTNFYTHELNEQVLPLIQSESLAAAATPQVLAVDLAHALAFRRGLGNSLFATPHSHVTAKDIAAYASEAFAKSNLAVVGTGISTEALSSAVTKAFGSGSGSSSLTSSATKYYGGEQRVPLDSHANALAQPTMVIAYGSTSAPTPEILALPHLLGGESSLKWVPGTTPLSIAAEKIPGSSAKSFLMPYSDASLFGVVITAPTDEGVKALAKEVASIIKGAGEGVKEEDVKKAVAKAKFTAASALETRDGLAVIAGPQLLSSGSLEDVASSFGKVSASSLGKATKELFKNKATVVSIGDLHVLPYADELGL